MAFSRDENIPPHLCLPTMDECTAETMNSSGGPRPPLGFRHQDSPKSISLMDGEEEDDDIHRFEATTSGCIEVEIAPHLAARFDEYDYDHGYESDPEPATRRRSLTQTATFPSHLPFPALESPRDKKKKLSSTPIQPKPNTDRSQWIMESLQKMDVGAEQRRMNSAASVGIDSILSGMRRHRDNDRVQRYGCGALQKLASQSETNRALISNAGGVLDILTAMERHRDRASIQECGCLALSSLSKAANGNAFIAQHNGIETILCAMRAHLAHEAVQKNACLVLLGLACSSANHNTTIARLGGIEDIMAAMSCHRGNSAIREYGSAALWSLAYMNSQNGAAIEKAGGLEAIFEALNSTDKEQPPAMSQEDQCMLVINKQKMGETEAEETSQKGRQGVDAILSVFVRPLQVQQ